MAILTAPDSSSLTKLQIGDPKMDSGCVEDEEDIENDFDVSQSLSVDELIWLIDELTCREVRVQPSLQCKTD